MATDTRKTERFNPRFDLETREMLRDLAEHYLESQSAVLRQLVRERWHKLPEKSRKKLRRTP